MPAYNDKALAKWARSMFSTLKGINKVKVKTNKAPGKYFYEDGGICYYDEKKKKLSNSK